MTTAKQKPKRTPAITVILSPYEKSRLNAMVRMDRSTKAQVIRKALDFAYEHRSEALKPRI